MAQEVKCKVFHAIISSLYQYLNPYVKSCLESLVVDMNQEIQGHIIHVCLKAFLYVYTDLE